jgi:hypothetical protein
MLRAERNNWPCGGEVNWGENSGGVRDSTTLTDVFCSTTRQPELLPQVVLRADFARWQTLGITWTPNEFVWTLNGHVESTIRNLHVPRYQLVLDVQNETNDNCWLSYHTRLNPQTPARVSMDMDWVVAYARDHR